MAEKLLTGLEKAAVLLKTLPGDVMGKVLRRLDSRQAGIINAELEKLKKDGQLTSKAAEVLDEAAKILDDAKKKPARPVKGQPAALAPATQIDVRLDGTPGDPPPPPAPAAPADPMPALASLPAELLAKALESETSRTISLLLNGLDIEFAGEVFKRLSAPKRREVSQRFTEQPIANEELLKRIARGVWSKCRTLSDSPSAPAGETDLREKRVAALLRSLERTERTETIALLEQADAELMARVKSMLYQFEDIERMENTSVQKLLSEVDVKSLALAMRGAPEEIESKVLANLSKRAQAALREETELSGNVPAAKIREGRKTIVEAIQRLDERGDLVLIET
jgi:flagellar motor switch protein FliG